MNFKPFNIHRFTNDPKVRGIRGFTAVVEPSATDERKVRVRMAFCQWRDMYCRKVGVQKALNTPCVDFECNARETLDKIQEQVDHRPLNDFSLDCWIRTETELYKYFF
jgi:hypothetical protein